MNDHYERIVEAIKEHALSFDSLDRCLAEIYRDGQPPVTIQQFLDDDYYLGKIGRDLYPENRPDIEDIFDPKNDYIEVILTGGISWGKTFLTCLSLCYMIYSILRLNDPHRWLGGSPASPIVIINMSLTAQKAKEVIFNRVKTMIDSSPYFREEMPRDMRLNDSLVWRLNQLGGREDRIRTGSQLIFKPGTGDSLCALGDDIYAGAADELNFFRVIERSKRAYGEALDPAQRLYDVISRRMKSRFSAGGLPFGKFFLLSSAHYPDDFIERRIAEAAEAGELGKTVKVIRKPMWAPKTRAIRGMQVFSGKTFRVEVGTSRTNSRVLDDYDKRTGLITPRPGVGRVEGKVIDVPVELWDDFNRDVEGSVRDFAGEVTRAILPFFADTSVIYQAESRELNHPWSKEETTLEDGSTLRIEEVFECDEKDGKWKPRRHPGKLRYVHVDLGERHDAAGIAVVHVAGWKKIFRLGKEYDEPVFEVDLMLRVNPPVGGEIKFSKIRDIIFQLRSYGMPIGMVTYDSWQSFDSIQILKTSGIASDVLSVDKELAPYNYLKDCFYDGRIIMYRYPPLVAELVQLEKRKDRVDHPPNGSKDVADALCGAVYSAFLSELRLSPGFLEARMPSLLPKSDLGPEQKRRQEERDAEEEMRKYIGGSTIVRG